MSGRTFLLEDWITIRSSLTNAFTQDPGRWLDLSGFSDVVIWIDVPEVTPPGGTNTNYVQLTLQTAPSPDDAYFGALAPSLNFSTASPYYQASVTPFILRSAQSLSVNNLMRFHRWQITPTGSGTWDLTFRIRVVANRSPTFVPPLIPGCVFWIRADLGITPVTSLNVTGWADQSGSNDPNKDLVSGVNPALVLADANYNNQPTVNFAGSAYMTTPSWATQLVQPNTWVIVGNPGRAGFLQVAIESNDKVSGQDISQTAGNDVQIFTSSGFVSSSTMPTPGVILAEFDGATSNIYVNSVTAPTAGTVGVGGTTGQASLTLGSSDIAWNPAGLNFWDGKFAEVIAYNAILTANQKGLLRSYLRGRYGMTIS